ncbi:MAG: class I adenylate-forming enzyme family protein [Acidimicrobiia bacterium]
MEYPETAFRPTIPDALHHAVEISGSRPFIVTPARRMTYAEAEVGSRHLAKRMLAAGMGKGTRVGLYFTYGQEWVVAWLAASRIGALVMPLATTYRPSEIRKVLRIGDIDTLIMASTVLGKDMQQMLEDSVPGLAEATGPELFLADTPSLRSVWVTGDTDRVWATPVDLEAAADLPAGITDELLAQLEAEVVPADLAQVTYTSGSSADPKGVVHTHGTVIRATAGMSALMVPGSEPPVFFCAFPFFWIGGTLILGAALQTGATVLVIERFEPGAALAMIEEHQATSVMGWPSLIQAMRDDPSFATRKLPEIPGLTMGPADTALASTPVPGIPGHRGMSETVGNIMSVQHRAIDPDTGDDVPDMEEGELLVRGYGLMHGYYKKERHEVFDDDGWLHTGDRVFIHGGRPYFVGRFTEMVKSQGANVAPREVELFLEETFPEILYAFVVGMPHPERGEEVTAVLVAAQGHEIDAADVQRRSREQISGFKVPTRIEIWNEADVPWLGSGKPDKLAIRTRLDGG